VSRDTERPLADVLAAIAAIRSHLHRGSLDDGLVFDAVRVRLIEIGEAVKDVDRELLTQHPDIPWDQVAGMRDRLAHRYFDTSHAIVAATVEQDLPELEEAVRGLLNRSVAPPGGGGAARGGGLWGGPPRGGPGGGRAPFLSTPSHPHWSGA
jgi:uncharacterized protein with HEPN domain